MDQNEKPAAKSKAELLVEAAQAKRLLLKQQQEEEEERARQKEQQEKEDELNRKIADEKKLRDQGIQTQITKLSNELKDAKTQLQQIKDAASSAEQELKNLEEQKPRAERDAAHYAASKEEHAELLRKDVEVLASDPDTKLMMKDPAIKEDVYGENKTKYKRAHASEKKYTEELAAIEQEIPGKATAIEELKAQAQNLENEIAEKILLLEELRKETPEYKEAEEKKLTEETQKEFLKIADELLSGKSVSVSDVERNKDARLVPYVHSYPYSQLSPEKREAVGSALKLKAHQDIERSLDYQSGKAGMRNHAGQLKNLDEYQAGRNAALNKIHGFIEKYKEYLAKFEELSSAVRQKAEQGDETSRKITNGFAKAGSPESFVFGTTFRQHTEEMERDLKEGYSSKHRYLYSPKDITAYVENADAFAEKMLASLEAGDVEKMQAHWKTRQSRPNAGEVVDEQTVSYIEKNGGLEAARQKIEAATKEDQEYREKLFALADAEIDLDIVALDINLLKEENGKSYYNGGDSLRDDLKYSIERVREEAGKKLLARQLMEAKNADRLDEKIELKKQEGFVNFPEVQEKVDSLRLEIEKLGKEKENLLADKRTLERKGHATSRFDLINQSKESYDGKMEIIDGDILTNGEKSATAEASFKTLATKTYLEGAKDMAPYTMRMEENPATLREYLDQLKDIITLDANKQAPENKVELLKKYDMFKRQKQEARARIPVKSK